MIDPVCNYALIGNRLITALASTNLATNTRGDFSSSPGLKGEEKGKQKLSLKKDELN